MANINDFIASFKDTELARPCNYTVWFNRPGSDILDFRCEAAELPQRAFSVVEQKTYGPIELFPVHTFYNRINLTFLCSDNMKEKDYFDAWMDSVAKGTYKTNTSLSTAKFDLAYRQDRNGNQTYATDIHVDQYNLEGNKSYGVILKEAFPISVHTMGLSWNAQNDIHKIIVTFGYRYFETETIL